MCHHRHAGDFVREGHKSHETGDSKQERVHLHCAESDQGSVHPPGINLYSYLALFFLKSKDEKKKNVNYLF